MYTAFHAYGYLLYTYFSVYAVFHAHTYTPYAHVHLQYTRILIHINILFSKKGCVVYVFFSELIVQYTYFVSANEGITKTALVRVSTKGLYSCHFCDLYLRSMCFYSRLIMMSACSFLNQSVRLYVTLLYFNCPRLGW